MSYYRTDGVILRAQDFGEADRLLTLLSPDLGKITAIAKGAKRLDSSFAGKIEPLNQLNFFLVNRKSLDIVSQIKLLENNHPLKADLKLLCFSSFILELFENFSLPQEKSPPLYRLLLTLLARLKNGGSHSPLLLTCWGELQLLKLAGFQLRLDSCVNCRKEEKLSLSCSLALGGILCADCAEKIPQTLTLKTATFKLYNFLLNSPAEVLPRVAPPPEILAELAAWLEQYISFLLLKSLKSACFLKTCLEPVPVIGYNKD